MLQNRRVTGSNHAVGAGVGETPRFGVVLIARSGPQPGRRRGTALRFLGRSLVEHSARLALASGAAEVVVVVDSDRARRRLRGLSVRIVTADAPTGGLGDAISAGVAALSSGIESAVVTLGDRPGVTADHLNRLASALSEGQTIVASEYGGVIGAPCAFSRAEFPALLSLSGPEGARNLVRARCAATIAFAAAKIRVAALPTFIEIPREIRIGDVPAPTLGLTGSRAPPQAPIARGIDARRNSVARSPPLLESPCPNVKHLPSSNCSSSSRSSPSWRPSSSPSSRKRRRPRRRPPA